jgi:response regulator RpfG family c-di-GMP phosphodiesterase
MAEGQIRAIEVLPLLLVTAEDQNERSLRALLDGTPRALYRASNCDEALLLLDCLNPSVVLVEADSSTGGWKRLLNRMSKLQHSPELIVFSCFADNGLWAEVLNRGGYDVLAVPFDAAEVWRSISLASASQARKLASGSPPRVAPARAATAA